MYSGEGANEAENCTLSLGIRDLRIGPSEFLRTVEPQKGAQPCRERLRFVRLIEEGRHWDLEQRRELTNRSAVIRLVPRSYF
ncbi:hypothetical protein ASF25_21425 [Methylobacterium sp. Leaf100]|nr:hypothetical protein ASF25_21425 [Methylobacterium sp. Leaf100]